MNLKCEGGYGITDIHASDAASYVTHLQDREIYERTLRIPFPYGEHHAREWIQIVDEETRRLGQSVNWAIRNPDGLLIGGIGLHDYEPGKTHKTEIGYWLAKPFWNQGIMTRVVSRISRYALEELSLVRLTAHVFAGNTGSFRVLEKCGFQREGTLRKHYLKDGKYLDGILYAKLA